MTENIFGKIRGRFDLDAAREADAGLESRAMACICAMPADRLAAFVARVNKVIRWSAGRPQIEDDRT